MSQLDSNNEALHRKMKDHQAPPTILITDTSNPKGYSLSGKIMLTAIVLLFFLVLLMISLHLYARWYLIRARRRHLLRRNLRRRRTNIVFFLDSPAPIPTISRGLDADLIASLPLFVYHPDARPENPPECSVCLSEFEPGESGRTLPKCGHEFHTDCIGMWFHSHDTCPLCRAPVEPQSESETRPEVVVTVCEPEAASSSGLRAAEEENRTGTETGKERRKPSPVTVEVPATGDEFGCDSPSSFRSPVSRMLSFKRILSRERKGSVSPSSGGGDCSSAAELGNAERGGKDEAQ